MRISDWSSDVCSSDLLRARLRLLRGRRARAVACDIILQLRALRILRRLRRRKLRDALGALALEVVVAARIERHLAALQMEDMVDDIVEQVAFVADHDELPRIAAQEALDRKSTRLNYS